MVAGVYTARLNVVGIEEDTAGSRAQAPATGTQQSRTSYPVITIKAKQNGDVNGDGTVDVADIATIIDEMAARARIQEALEE